MKAIIRQAVIGAIQRSDARQRLAKAF
jgi:hypothetical protein